MEAFLSGALLILMCALVVQVMAWMVDWCEGHPVAFWAGVAVPALALQYAGYAAGWDWWIAVNIVLGLWAWTVICRLIDTRLEHKRREAPRKQEEEVARTKQLTDAEVKARVAATVTRHRERAHAEALLKEVTAVLGSGDTAARR